MDAKTRTIEVDAATADLLEAQAAERGISVADFLAELASRADDPLPDDLEKMRAAGEGPWSPEALAEDERAFAEFERTGEGIPWEDTKAWLQSWGQTDELPPPKPRKL